MFDERDKLVVIARDKVTTLKAQGFSSATFYGEKELGGLHVMYVLNDSPDKYGLPMDPKFPETAAVWQGILQPMGWAVGGLTILGLALNYIVAREAKKQKELTGKEEGK